MKKNIHYLLTLILFVCIPLNLLAGDDFYYSYIPKKIYKDQVFPLTITSKKFKDPQNVSITFDTQNALFDKPFIVNNDSGIFFTFYFKVKDPHQIITPAFEIEANKKNYRLKPLKIVVTSLMNPEDFSGVYGSKFKIKHSQISEYNDENLLISLLIEAFEANLEDFHLQGIKEQSMEEIERDFANIEGEYFAIVPKSKKELTFTYFNTLQEKFVPTKMSLVLQDRADEEIDINPKDSSFDTFKKYLFIFFVIMFALLYYIRRDRFYLFFGIGSLIALITFYMPKERICVKKGASVYILPTETSTVSATTNKKIKKMALENRGDYVKIEYEEGLIGWIKGEDVCKD